VDISLKKNTYFDSIDTGNHVPELIILLSKLGHTVSPCKNDNEHWVSKNKIMEFPDLLTYVITPCSKVLLENLTVSQLAKKFPAFYGTRRFIAAFTTAHHLSLS